MTYLKDRNRELILLLLEKIKYSGDQSLIPYLKLWEKVDYKKVRAEILKTIDVLEYKKPVDVQAAQDRTESINEALKGSAPQDLLLKCWECSKRFTFTIAEQKFYKQKGFALPKRCKKCRSDRG
ncbi:zinc-ribbon domain-containing protein [Anaerobacillus sp. CMMVII]|uniref:zinc-ribbon domain-containing protein n=1 Tax=Anaerobacillus sp. CMMVII TaxID=2755588 RepID=UPI0021B7AA92|nr:zinc-ribbon domain-containing protein [Anaerobacillus sp. CMMVII]